MSEMGLLTSGRSHDGPQLQVREHHHGIHYVKTQSLLPHQFRRNQLGQEHQHHKLTARINGIPHKHPAEIRAQGGTFALLHSEYALGFSAHDRQQVEWHLEVRVSIERGGRLPSLESQPSLKDLFLKLISKVLPP